MKQCRVPCTMPFDLLCCVRPGVEDIQELDYSHHSLSDVPADVFVYERTLERLLCQSNRITELPRQLFMCHGLKYLDLSDNELQALPAAISSLVNLRHLNVSKNAITSLPDTMKCLKHLVFLDLSVNPLEKLPEAITNLIALNELYLNDTYLEYLPGNFGRLANLRILELRDNYLMILPKSLARSTELLRLDIGQNEFQQFPEVVGRFSKLRELWMDCNSLTNIPSTVRSLTSLIHLEASNNMIEELAPEISYCSELLDLSLSSNNLTQLPESIGNLNKLITLKLDNNKLYSLPESIGQLQQLEELMLLCNYLDKLPHSVGLLRKLQYLNIDENLLRTIPLEIGSCSKLSVLSLRSNKLTFIPSEIGHLSSLRVLNLVRNSLSCLPQSLLNCDKLVALWLSENQSKPLVPMQSEMDPHTYQQVLTCFLFPQVPLSPIESKPDESRITSNESQQASVRHISFVDMKSATKVVEKPGQLRRAPTPYPKELRALAKHARNVQKDGAQDLSPTMQSAVHIKAAKITPTFQQRFATDNNIPEISKSDREWSDANKTNNHELKDSDSENPLLENPYDRPLEINYHQEKTYQSVDHALYSESNDSAYGGLKDNNDSSAGTGSYVDRQCQQHTLEDRVDGIIQHSPHDFFGHMRQIEDQASTPRSNEIYDINEDAHVNITPVQQNFQRMSIASQEQNPGVRQSMESPYAHLPPMNKRQSYDQLSVASRDSHYGRCNDTNYHGSVYDAESYAQAKEKAYPRRRSDYNYHPHTHRELPNPRCYSFNQTVSGSSTMPNICHQLENKYNGSGSESHYYSGPDLQNPSPNANIYSITNSSPPYNPPQSPDVFSPTGHNHLTNPYRMTNMPLLSEDPAYSQVSTPHLQNTYSIYEGIPATPLSVSDHPHSPSSVHSDPMYGRGQPPPYHIAAAYTKQAQYFNGTG